MVMQGRRSKEVRRLRESPGVISLLAPIDERDPNWLALRLALWPDISKAEHLATMQNTIAQGGHVRLATSAEGAARGFVEALLVREFPDRIDRAPVVFFEGLYVCRNQSLNVQITRRLVQSVVDWSAAVGCLELAFDARFVYVAAQTLLGTSLFRQTPHGVFFTKAAAR